MAGNLLFVGGTTDCPLKGLGATQQNLVVGDTLVKLSGGQATLKIPLLRDPIFNLGNGIYVNTWDIIKGVIFGVLTKFGVEPMFKSKSKKSKDAFKNGFVVGGAIGGLESAMDGVESVVHDTTEGLVPDTTDLTHNLFQGVLVQGAVAGLTNALLTWAKV